MRGLERREDALQRAQFLECVQCFVVAGRHVLDAAERLQQRMLGSDAGVVEAGGDGMRLLHLAVRVLQDHGVGALQHAGRAGRERRGVLPQPVAGAAGLHADELDVVREQRMKEPDRIRAAADAGE